jgi:uncharacterized membrane protein YphA (DoxX/SURF4 family)
MYNGTIIFLQIALSFAFMYAGIAGLINPVNWIGYLPDFVTASFSAEMALRIWSISELFIGAWILSGIALRLSALVSAILLFGMVVFNLPQLDIIFRDISLGFAAIALVYAAKEGTG